MSTIGNSASACTAISTPDRRVATDEIESPAQHAGDFVFMIAASES
jgi:hypothetical protein